MKKRRSDESRCPRHELCSCCSKGRNLLVIILSLVVNDVEELELVNAARGGDDAEPVTELLLLEELLGAAEGKKKSC